METIVFDIGETLVRDDRHWASWADWLGVPAHTVSALVGAAVVGGGSAADALALLRPGMDVAEAERAREAAGRGEHLGERDLYPDVRPALAGLRSLGLRVVVAGDRPARAAEQLAALDLPVDHVVTPAECGGLAKPDPGFFARVLEASGADPRTTVYVGDHPAEDLFPARAAGLRTAHLRRGPFGHWWADHPDVVGSADWRVDALTELVALPGLVRERQPDRARDEEDGDGGPAAVADGEEAVPEPERRAGRLGVPALRALRSVR
ncbi:HAD family hydrolase [Streptomyces sp. NBC_01218]|uniref:HAD family hydrolase n=1 Tax=unclassified Streptomyces TaxID=2593676 RepID=UPI0023B8C904|nr:MULTISPECIES: HAD family hydrolase [unclassified Streptomyces]WEH43693.1 HAD family hydrolase [Streptomyces sp. AM 2-1-1]WSQ55337.1 HAD family hydrolase [Streptomyces sp. NBC_01218]